MRTWPRASPREAIDGTEKREGETERKEKVHEGELMGQVRQEEGVKGGGEKKVTDWRRGYRGSQGKEGGC